MKSNRRNVIIALLIVIAAVCIVAVVAKQRCESQKPLSEKYKACLEESVTNAYQMMHPEAELSFSWKDETHVEVTIKNQSELSEEEEEFLRKMLVSPDEQPYEVSFVLESLNAK